MIALGSTVKDNITGFEGIAVARMTHLHGCVHIAIQPKELKDGKPQKEYLFDEQRVVLLIDSNRPARVPKLELGSKVRDQISGYEGVLTVWVDELYAPPLVSISSSNLDNGKLIDSIHIPETRAELIEKIAPQVSEHSSAKSGSISSATFREHPSR
jgi:hypothetical protein